MVTLGYIENFLTPVEIEWFVWYWKCLPSKIDTGQRVRSLTHHDQPFFHRIKEKLVEKIEQNNPHEKISTVNLNWDYLPGGVHSDGYIDYDKNDTLGHTYLIPLQMEQSFQTIIFEQISKKAVTLNKELGLGDSGIVTYNQVKRDYFNLSDELFDMEVYNKYLGHLDYVNLRGLYTSTVFDWKLGRAMVWPRERLHCSANFSSTSSRNTLLITTKIC